MKYIFSNASGEDTMEIEVSGEEITAVRSLVEPVNSEPPLTAEDLQKDLELYTRNRSDMTIEQALGCYAGGYASIREAGE